MRRGGVSADRPVVVYDDWSSMAATRAWWLLTSTGTATCGCSTAAGRRWTRSGGAVETECPTSPTGRLPGRPGHLPVVDAPARRGSRRGRAARRAGRRTVPGRGRAGRPGGRPRARRRQPAHRGEPRRRPLPAADELPRTVRGDRGGRARWRRTAAPGVTATHDLFALHLLGRRGGALPGQLERLGQRRRTTGRHRAVTSGRVARSTCIEGRCSPRGPALDACHPGEQGLEDARSLGTSSSPASYDVQPNVVRPSRTTSSRGSVPGASTVRALAPAVRCSASRRRTAAAATSGRRRRTGGAPRGCPGRAGAARCHRSAATAAPGRRGWGRARSSRARRARRSRCGR